MDPTLTSNRRLSVVYAFMVAAAIAGFVAITAIGRGLDAPPPAPSHVAFDGTTSVGTPHALAHVLLALAVVIVVARGFGALFRRLGQPPVVGEMLAGILLGPSLLGRAMPDAFAFLMPPNVAPLLGIVAEIGVVLFLFLVGLELDTTLLRKRTHASIAVSHASITAPFLLGSALALLLYPTTATADVPFTPFALFVAVAMSVTAFPVLARILGDTGLSATPLGAMSLACAAVDDVSAWCLLALVVGIARATTADALTTIALATTFTLVMLLVVRPLVVRMVARQTAAASGSATAMAAVVTGLLLSALATEAIGIHALFGAFLFGAIIPHDSHLARAATTRLHDLVVVLFLPMFFAFTGLRTEFGLVHGLQNWSLCLLVIAVATIGKFGGSYVAARCTGIANREAIALGALMNTRGLMELVVLNVGLDLRIISPTLFAMMVTMAVVTTFLTTPVLHLLGLVGRCTTRPAPDQRRDEPGPFTAAATVPDAPPTDVVICGGGFAGLLLARQLRREMPDLAVTVVEKTARPLPAACHKVGESSVELGCQYFERLGLREYMRERQLPKMGLRFFPGGGDLPLHQRAEIGPCAEPIVPSYQIDRGRIEDDLRGMNERDGVTRHQARLPRRVDQVAAGEAFAARRDECAVGIGTEVDHRLAVTDLGAGSPRAITQRRVEPGALDLPCVARAAGQGVVEGEDAFAAALFADEVGAALVDEGVRQRLDTEPIQHRQPRG
ncbi:MAG: cation:proton antiporter [Planctomycetes bacterium]|nr:cation:proton antiporter [Planctomycetota bacterium]